MGANDESSKRFTWELELHEQVSGKIIKLNESRFNPRSGSGSVSILLIQRAVVYHCWSESLSDRGLGYDNRTQMAELFLCCQSSR